MAHSNVVSVEEMRGHLRSVDWVREQLAATEPLAEAPFLTGDVKLQLSETDSDGKEWHQRELTDLAPATLEVSGGEKYALTRQALMELASECHIPRGYQTSVPPWLLTQNVNWWLGTGLGERSLKLLTSGTVDFADAGELPLARAMCRATISPFSNIKLLDTMIDGLEKKYGKGEILADYKFQHDLESTAVRLIVPGQQRVIAGSQVADDTWSTGIQFKNSLIGLKQTEVSGYLFRWWCTNGAIDTMASSGGFARRGSTESDVMLWAAEMVDEVLGGLEPALDAVQALTAVPVTNEVTAVLGDLFTQHSLPVREQRRIIASMADTDDMTMYGLMQATTQAANLDGLDWRAVESLMMMGGHIIHSAEHGRCESCRRLLPEGWEANHSHEHAEVAA